VPHVSEVGNPIESISKVVGFEMFHEIFESRLLNNSKKNNAGDKPFDVAMMFKIMILQRYYNLGDKQVDYQIVDRMSFKKFQGIETGDKVPDEKTIWAFRERLTQTASVEELFELFISHLEVYTFVIKQEEPPQKSGAGGVKREFQARFHKEVSAKFPFATRLAVMLCDAKETLIYL